jgi:glycosyltransferase involved in cell wall biosynthesis
MRDNALAGALKRRGHDVTLIPLYTPLRTEPTSSAIGQVFYGGVNVYLQHSSPIFRHTPRALDWLLDRPWLLNAAGKIGSQTSPAKLASLTMEIVKGDEGSTEKELRRLLRFMKTEVRPQVVSLPNLMFIGMARLMRQELGAPVVLELTGEDIFLDAMSESDRLQLRDAIRRRVPDVARFVATSRFYAGKMAEYLGVEPERIDVVYPGVPAEYLTEPPRKPRSDRAASVPTVGYLARMCPEKGIDRLVEAMLLLHEMPGMGNVRLRAAGYVGQRDAPFYDDLRRRVASSRLNGRAEFLGEVTREQKLDLLDGSDVFSAPTAYAEAKGIFVLEALARGVPVVQPAHGAFPELIERTGGGVLVPPNDARALAESLADLVRDPARRKRLGEAGREAVRSSFTEDHMAEKMLDVYQAAAA